MQVVIAHDLDRVLAMRAADLHKGGSSRRLIVCYGLSRGDIAGFFDNPSVPELSPGGGGGAERRNRAFPRRTAEGYGVSDGLKLCL